MHLKVFVDLIFIRSGQEEMELQYIMQCIPNHEKDNVVRALDWANNKGLMVVRRHHTQLWAKPTSEGKFFFGILRELVIMLADYEGL